MKKTDNKGFSLVELIIVIAIMAILVGVMAPQLIKYIEKTNVSNDVQICDSIRTAVKTAIMDPAVLAKNPTLPASGDDLKWTQLDSAIQEEALDTLGVADITDLKLKSANADIANLKIKATGSGNDLLVYITDTDMSGKKQKLSDPKSDGSGCIYAGTGE